MKRTRGETAKILELMTQDFLKARRGMGVTARKVTIKEDEVFAMIDVGAALLYELEDINEENRRLRKALEAIAEGSWKLQPEDEVRAMRQTASNALGDKDE